MKAFTFNGETYIRCIPGKTLFHSTMVHQVVNRGDVFALRVSDQQLTIISGKSVVEHIELETNQVKSVSLTVKSEREKLKAYRDAIKQRQSELPL